MLSIRNKTKITHTTNKALYITIIHIIDIFFNFFNNNFLSRETRTLYQLVFIVHLVQGLERCTHRTK